MKGNSEKPRQWKPFAVRLTRDCLRSLQNDVFLLSNRSDIPPKSTLEFKIESNTSRESIWEIVVRHIW